MTRGHSRRDCILNRRQVMNLWRSNSGGDSRRRGQIRSNVERLDDRIVPDATTVTLPSTGGATGSSSTTINGGAGSATATTTPGAGSSTTTTTPGTGSSSTTT